MHYCKSLWEDLSSALVLFAHALSSRRLLPLAGPFAPPFHQSRPNQPTLHNLQYCSLIRGRVSKGLEGHPSLVALITSSMHSLRVIPAHLVQAPANTSQKIATHQDLLAFIPTTARGRTAQHTQRWRARQRPARWCPIQTLGTFTVVWVPKAAALCLQRRYIPVRSHQEGPRSKLTRLANDRASGHREVPRWLSKSPVQAKTPAAR